MKTVRMKRGWVVVLLCVCVTVPCFGANTVWNTGEGSWSAGANWSLGEPGPGLLAWIDNGGTALCEAGEVCEGMTLGSTAGQRGTVRLDDATDSLTSTVGLVSLGLSGTGVVIQANGSFYSEKGMRLGVLASGYGSYVLSNGTAVMYGDINVGAPGIGEIFQSGGTLDLFSAGVNNGRFTLANGRYELTGGRLSAGFNFTIGASAGLVGRFILNGPTAVLCPTNSSLSAGVPATMGNAGEGILEIRDGVLYSDGGLTVGNTYKATVIQTGGAVNFYNGRGVWIGSGATATGLYELLGGTLTVDGATWMERSVIVGGSGTGTLRMGDANGCGVLTQKVAGAGMIVGWSAGSVGTFQGWSDDGTGNRLHLTGPLYVNSGRIIADGYGTQRSLDLTRFDFKGNSIESPTNGVMGWFAQNRGELRLNTIWHFANTKIHHWGESVGDTTPDMINSALLQFMNNQGVVQGRLYAVDHGSVYNTTAIRPISVIQFSGTASTYDLTIRYDHTAAAAAAVSESDLKLYRWNGSVWADITASVDTVARCIKATGVSGDGQFAVGVPAPPAGTVVYFN